MIKYHLIYSFTTLIDYIKRRRRRIIDDNKQILIITEDDAITDSLNKYSNIDILKIKLDKESARKINENFREKYNYIFFTKVCEFSEEFKNYLPVYFIDNSSNKLFINELIVNPVLRECADIVLSSLSVVEVSIFLKHILKTNIKYDNFHFRHELRQIKMIQNCTNHDIRCFKKSICHSIKIHYSQGSFLRKIKFHIKKSTIIKRAFYKILDNVIDTIKDTNELVFKEFISIIV